MSHHEFNEHLTYWKDDVKIDRYRRALAEVVQPGDTVLDLGSGTGMLGLLACEAGAGRVIAVDSGPIATVARDVFERNGVGDRVEVVRANSTDVRLPQPVDVVVGDQIGGLAFSAGVFKFYEDAAKRLLKPSGVTVPHSFDLMLAAVEHPEAREAIDPLGGPLGGFDLGPLYRLVQNTMRPVFMRNPEVFLSSPETIHKVDASDASKFRLQARLRVLREGALAGIAGMFVAQMSPTVQMSNVPGHPDMMEHRWQDLFPVDEPLAVERDDVVVVDLLVNPRTYLAAWDVSVERCDGPSSTERHSTFEGQLLDLSRLRMLAGQPVRLTALGRAATRLLADLPGDELEIETVTERLASELPHLQRAEIDRVVKGLAAVLASTVPDGAPPSEDPRMQDPVQAAEP